MIKENSIIFNEDARKKILQGMEIIYRAVSITLGPKGKFAIIEKPNSLPQITKDGVTVAKSIKLKDKFASLGSELIKEVASQTNAEVGDGTTTATILTYSFCNEAFKLLTSGYSSSEIKNGMELAISDIIEELNKFSKKISNSKDVEYIARISSNNDLFIGKIISNALEKVGTNGVVTIEEAKGTTTTLEIIDGIKINNRGYLSSYFVTNNQKMICDFYEPYILITNKKISLLNEVIKILEEIRIQSKPLLIIADDIEGEALQGLVLNKLKGILNVCAIKAPSYGNDRNEILQDLSALTGGKAILNESGIKIENTEIDDLGKCKRIIVDRNSTTIISELNSSKLLEERINYVKDSINNPTLSKEEKENIKKRLSLISNGVAVIKVGGATEIEMLERKDRIEDALNAAKAAYEEGIIPGGGISLVRAAENCKNKNNSPGYNAIINSCLQPFKKIIENSEKSPDVILNEIFDKNINKDYGYDANKNLICNMIENGIIDPIKVTKCSLKNAFSIASMFCSLECIILNSQKNELIKDLINN